MQSFFSLVVAFFSSDVSLACVKTVHSDLTVCGCAKESHVNCPVFSSLPH